MAAVTLTVEARKRIRALVALAVGGLFFVAGLLVVVRAYVGIFRAGSFHGAADSADLLAMGGGLIVLGGMSGFGGARWMQQLQPVRPAEDEDDE